MKVCNNGPITLN